MYRRLAVPLVVRASESAGIRPTRSRTLRAEGVDPEEYSVLSRLSENRMRIERLRMDVEARPEAIDSSEIVNELDFLKATVELGFAEISNEIEEIPSSEEIFEEALA